MATIKDIKIDSYCGSVDEELSKIKMEVDTLRENLQKEYSAGSSMLRTGVQHLIELAADIDHKRQLLIKDCPIGPRRWDANPGLFRMPP